MRERLQFLVFRGLGNIRGMTEQICEEAAEVCVCNYDGRSLLLCRISCVLSVCAC